MIETRPSFAHAMLRGLVGRFRNADRMRIEFAAANTLGRVAARLAELVERHGETTDDGIAITLPLSQEELAGWTGASREAVNKALQVLRSLHMIQTGRRRLTVLDADGLRRLAG